MNYEQFQDMDCMEETHFWFKARREIIQNILAAHCLDHRELSVLEIGCGTGGNLKYFKSIYSNLVGCEVSEDAINFARHKLPDFDIRKCNLPDDIPFENSKFDVIFLFDVLEHIKDDAASLESIKQKLNVGGSLVVTVPAYQFLYGAYDKFLFHFRRYSKTRLLNLLTAAGFKITYSSYFNCWLFPAVLISRLLEKMFNKTSKYVISGNKTSLINSLFYRIMRSEKHLLLKKYKLPFGSSVIAIARNI
jgi:SAM-dependent methyltransferase